DPCADGQQHRQPGLWLEIESESDGERERRQCEVSDEHRATPHETRRGDGCEGPDEPAHVEQVGSPRLPFFCKDCGGGWVQANTGGVLDCKGSAQERDECV